MTTLVFGGLGHVGSWIVHDLVARGEEVAIFDAGAARYDSLKIDYLEPYRDRFTLEEVDVLDTHTLYERMRAYDGRIDAVIFGVAVIAGPHFAKRPFRHIEINTMGMLNVVEACRVLGVKKFVNLSSGAVYGNHPGGQTEQTPYMATDLYCATKIANEVLALQYGATYGMDVRNARLFAVYGPGKLPSRMHVLYQALFGPLEGLKGISSPAGADQAMDWTHVRDTAVGVVRVLDVEGIAGESFNISCGVPVEHRTILAEVAQMVKSDSGITVGPGKLLDRGAPLDISKAKSVLGFEPRFANIRDGLADYRDWLAAQ